MEASIPASSQREPATPLAPSLAKKYGLARLNTPLSPKPCMWRIDAASCRKV